jgi:hypothetical protein
MYDAISGKCFDMNHPVWIEHNKTKKRTVSSRLTKVKKDELTRLGLVRLYPPVSEVASVADGFSSFGIGANWGRDMTLKAYASCIESLSPEAGSPKPDAIEALAKTLMTAARDKGSELHGAFHLLRTGQLANPTADQQTFHDACMDFCKSRFETIKTEVSFCDEDLGCGGTCDVDGQRKQDFSGGVDWKTVQDWREPRMSELAQVGGYALHFKWNDAYVGYYHQTQKQMRHLYLNHDVLISCRALFVDCLKLYEATEQFDLDNLVIQ